MKKMPRGYFRKDSSSKSTARGDGQSSRPIDEVHGLETMGRKVLDMPRDGAEEIGPLGLTLTKTQSFLELIETELKKTQQEPEKFKASTLSAISLQIGSWKVASSNECNVVAKFYYGKQRVLWEVLVDGRKRKMEIAWLNISGITASSAKGKPDTLEIQLERPPKFYCEKDSPPGRNTKWALADDFTGGYAQVYKRHSVVFKEGALEDSLTKLLHSDDRLYRLSQSSFSAFSPSMFFDVVPVEQQRDLVRQASMQHQTMDAARSSAPLQTAPPIQEMGPNLPSVLGVSSTTPAEDFVSYQPSDSWDVDSMMDLSSHLAPFQATPNFPSVPLEATTMLETGNYLPDNFYSTVLPGPPKEVPLWNAGAQSMPGSNYGAQETQFHGYAPLFSGLPRPAIEPGLAPFYADERSLLGTGSYSFGPSMDVSVQAGGREGPRPGGDGEYSLSDPNLAMVPTAYCPDEAQVLPQASSFMRINNDGRPKFGF